MPRTQHRSLARLAALALLALLWSLVAGAALAHAHGAPLAGGETRYERGPLDAGAGASGHDLAACKACRLRSGHESQAALTGPLASAPGSTTRARLAPREPAPLRGRDPSARPPARAPPVRS